MASRAQLSTSLCRSSVKVPLRLGAMAGGWLGGAWLLTAAPTVLVLLVPVSTNTPVTAGSPLPLEHHTALGMAHQELKTPCRLILSFASRTHSSGNCKGSYGLFLRVFHREVYFAGSAASGHPKGGVGAAYRGL